MTVAFFEGQRQPDTCKTFDVDPDLAPERFGVVLPDGKISMPTNGFAMGCWTGPDGESYACFYMTCNGQTFHEMLTHEGARLLAKQICLAADVVETDLAGRANAQLAATLEKRGQ